LGASEEKGETFVHNHIVISFKVFILQENSQEVTRIIQLGVFFDRFSSCLDNVEEKLSYSYAVPQNSTFIWCYVDIGKEWEHCNMGMSQPINAVLEACSYSK
jgi:hypothetical protein